MWIPSSPALPTLVALIVSVFGTSFPVGTGEAAGNVDQLAFQESELSQFIHFSVATFANVEQDCNADHRPYPASLFAPDRLDTDQWLAGVKAMGARQACLTVKHTGGFALWPSKHTNYSVLASPYKRDIVRQFLESCEKFKVQPCFYFIVAWDCFEWRDTPEVYLTRIEGMLTELLTQYPTQPKRLWFDQYNFPSGAGRSPVGLFPQAWARVVALVRRLAPHTLIVPGPDGCIPVRGEKGNGSYPVWYAQSPNPATRMEWCDLTSAPTNGPYYTVWESDMSIQNPGDSWFWHKDHAFLDAPALWTHWLSTVGRGQNFILNIPPNVSGLVPEEYLTQSARLGEAIARSFSKPVASILSPVSVTCGAAGAGVVLSVPAGMSFNSIVLREGLANGQVVRAYDLAVRKQNNSTWVPLPPSEVHGLSVGQRVVDMLSSAMTHADAVRFRCLAAASSESVNATLRHFGVYMAQPPT